MADRFSTAVTIGGPLNLELLREIIGSATSNGFSIDWEGNEKDDYLLRECIKKLNAGDKQLEFNDHEIPNDLLEDFTSFLTEREVPWVAEVDAKYEYDGEFRWWLPGMEVAYETILATCDCDNAAATADMLKEWKRQGWDLDKIIEFMEHTPPDLPPIVWTGPMEDTTGSEKTG